MEVFRVWLASLFGRPDPGRAEQDPPATADDPPSAPNAYCVNQNQVVVEVPRTRDVWTTGEVEAFAALCKVAAEQSRQRNRQVVRTIDLLFAERN